MLEGLRDEQFCYVTTTGRRTGRPHEIEIWFVVTDDAIYLLAGGGERADWVKNMRADPSVQVRIGSSTFSAAAQVDPPGEGPRPREALAAKYQGWEPGRPLSDWAREALLVRIDPAEG